MWLAKKKIEIENRKDMKLNEIHLPRLPVFSFGHIDVGQS
jgi:hypothetical protein